LRLEENTITINSDFGNVFIDSKSSYTIKCNCNNGESVKTYTITYDNIDSIPIPIKSGYAFAGWYTDSSLNSKFNFNTTIYDDLTLYAKWVQASISYIYDYTSESPFTIAAINFVQNGANFVSLTTGRYKVYYKLASGNATSVSISNTTTSKNLASFGASSTIYNYVEIDLVEGNVYSIVVSSTFNNCYVALYLDGEKPNFMPNCYFNHFELGEPMLVSKDSILKLSIADIPSDKMFGGWYLNGEPISYSLTFDLIVPEGNSILTTRFLIDSDLIGFEYEIVDNQIIITGIEDKTVKNIVVPNFVHEISEGAFNGCSSLESITLPFIGDKEHLSTDSNQFPFGYIFGTSSYANSTYVVQEYVVSTTSSAIMETYYIPSELKEVTITRCSYIQRGAFYNCSGLTSIIIPDSVESIGSYSFHNCKGLKNIIIPNSVKNIKSSAFQNCSGLTSITIPYSVTNIERYAFSDCDGVISIVVDQNNEYYDSRMNCNAIIDTATNTLIIGCKTTIIPNSVTSIEWGAFSGCSGLTSITIPNSITSIGGGAFSWCKGLTTIEIPDSVISIGLGAFSYCINLEDVIIPNSITSISPQAFQNCTNLTNIIIPKSISSIEWASFDLCSNLIRVYYGGSQSEWQNISIDSRNEPITDDIIYFYSETEPSETGNYWHYVSGRPTLW
nr:leucine-rich repeat protein [bacterium]